MATVSFSRILANIRRSYNSAKGAIDQKAERDLARARTRNEKELVKLRQRREHATLDKQLAEAKTATRKAELAARKAKTEAGDISVIERLAQFSKGLSAKPTRRRKKSTAKRTVKSPPKPRPKRRG